VSEQDKTDILLAIEKLRGEVAGLKSAQVSPVDCALHSESIKRMDKWIEKMDEADIPRRVAAVETQVGKRNGLLMGIGAFGVGVGYGLQYLVKWVASGGR